MNRRLFPLALSLALLAGCAPAPEPTPEPTPTPAAAVDFHTFLDAVNEKRRAVIEEGEPLDISPWTPDFADQNHTFTDGEMEALMTHRNMVDYLPPEKAREDLDVFFTLLRTTYGAYEYFGGDEVFEKLRAESIEILEDTTTPYGSTLIRLATALYLPLEGTVLDGHFTIGGSYLLSKLRTYYVPDIYISDPTGLSEDYVKPTIGPDGAITYGFFAMSEDGSDLPDTLGGYELSWTPCETVGPGHFVFAESEYQGIPTLLSRYMSADTPEGEAQLERFATCGGEYADAPLLIFDVRSNPGGYSNWMAEWFEGWTGQPAQPRRSSGKRISQIGCYFLDYPDEAMGTWAVSSQPGRWVEREGITFLLTDNWTASAGEDVLTDLHTVENTLVVGVNTGGCYLVSDNFTCYLPNSGLPVFFGTGLGFHETMENRDGIGYLPDLWVNPPDAMEAVARLCQYYGL
ncbi:S41 family peptidase [Flavonifractor plautii]|uniref:Tail specific protease domain-containing protein n=1 Tax=Flavonifractor plautii ATCC 29863 TaxID=411475 RepID=G9YXI8_FLAPL|nr:S41 family peptidase [Flavonifractor plautii]EHM37541.1 hypothetical protein HMPREF0372_04256 [Flavonifractor plautii ATCC 29863]QIA32511.1 hypothetical protein GXM20_19000 [Flavonifractor plautii]